MFRYGCLLLSLLACAPAQAEWVRLAHSAQSVFYLDPAVSKKVNGHVMVWVLRDHAGMRTGPAGTYLSSKDQFEIDCPGRRIRRLYSSDHAQAMGAGRAVASEHGPMSWNQATPHTVVSRIVDVACARS